MCCSLRYVISEITSTFFGLYSAARDPSRECSVCRHVSRLEFSFEAPLNLNSSSVNAGAPPENENSTYAGLSRVAVPFVGSLGDETKDTNKEGMSVVDVDMELVEEAEKNYKVREDIEGEGWHYTYRHQGGGKVE